MFYSLMSSKLFSFDPFNSYIICGFSVFVLVNVKHVSCLYIFRVGCMVLIFVLCVGCRFIGCSIESALYASKLESVKEVRRKKWDYYYEIRLCMLAW